MISWNSKTIVAALALLWATGCGKSEPGSEAAVPKTAAPESGKVVSYAPEPIGYTGQGTMWDRELLADALFSHLKAPKSSDTSAGWITFAPEPAKDIATAPVADLLGRNTLEFAAKSAAMYAAQTTAVLDLSVKDVWIVGSMQARCASPNELGVTIAFDRDGTPVHVGVAHPGDDQWHDVTCYVPLIRPFPSAKLTMTILKRGAAQSGASVRAASLRVVKDRPAGVPADTQLFNGNFEAYAFTNSYYPWVWRRWGSPDTLAELMTDGNNHLVRFAQPPDNGGVALTQQITWLTDADRGKTLTATVMATAGAPLEFLIAFRPMKEGKLWEELVGRGIHPGDGKAQKLTASIKLPADRLPDELYLDIYRKHASASTVVADDVTLTIE